MAENEAPIVHNPSSEPPNPFSSIISKFTQLFNFRFPPPPKKVEPAGDAGFRGGEVAEDKKPVTVRLPDSQTATVAPLKLEPEEVVEQDTNPALLWQVYAIGGFFVLRWVLARWKERRVNKKPSNEDSPPPPPQTEAAIEPDE